MRRIRTIGIFTGTLAVFAMLCTLRAAPTSRQVQPSGLQYEGSFRVPEFASGASSFDAGGGGLTYNPLNNTLLAVGRSAEQQVAEITIPTPAISTDLSSLPVATYRQGFVDILGGKLEQTSAGPERDLIGGLLVFGNALIASAYASYDADYQQVNSHFRTGLDFAATGDVVGPVRVGTAGAGFVGGYMSSLPPEWQSAFGGTAVTGQCCIPIISRTSSGPAISVFNPASIGPQASNTPATALLGYDLSHDPGESIFKGATEVKGVVVPPGSRSILFFGRHGTGPSCYGTGIECGDPTSEYKGYHAYPYVYRVWAYDLMDLLAVKKGQKTTWEPRPYAMWTLELPFQSSGKWIRGVAFDGTSRIFIAAQSDSELYARPVIHVLRVSVPADDGTLTAPAAPINVRIVSGG